MSALAIIAVACAVVAILAAIGIVSNELERIGNELMRANELEQAWQNEEREHRGNVVSIQTGKPPDSRGPRRPAPGKPTG